MLDSNVLISALLNPGLCRTILLQWRGGRFNVAISSALLEELRGVLTRAKFSNRIRQDDIKELLAFVEANALRIEPLKLRHRICRDKTDDHLFACAFGAGSLGIVSGDKDVLSVGPIGGLRIFSPRDFLTWLSSR